MMMYAGEREMTQYQSIPYQPQLKPSHSGGVIDMQRHYQGIDTRWTHRGELLVPVTFTTGLNYEKPERRSSRIRELRDEQRRAGLRREG